MSPEEYNAHLWKEIQIGLCWLVVLLGALGLFITAWVKDSDFSEPVTQVVVIGFGIVVVAGAVDSWFIRGPRNKKIRAAHAHLRKPQK